MRHRGVVWFATIWAPFLVWWLAEFPGEMWIDSFSVWHQVTQGPWDNHHPAPFVGLVWLSSAGGRSLAAATLVQTIAIAGALTYLALSLSRHWLAGRTPLVAASIVGWLPLVAPFALVLQKDAWELAALMVATAQVVRMASFRAPATGRTVWAVLFLSGLVAALVRWNGVATDLVAAAVLLLAFSRGLRLRAFATVAAAGVIGFVILLAIPHVFDVRPGPSADTNFERLADLGNYAADRPSLFTPVDREVLTRVAPFSEWRRQGGTGCDTVNYISFRLLDTRHRNAVVRANMDELSAVWSRLVRRDPTTLVRLRLCRAALAWSPVSLDGRTVLTVIPEMAPNRFGITSQPVFLGSVARSWADVSARNRVAQALAWRPVLWVLLAAALCVVRRPQWARSRLSAVSIALAVPLGVLASYAVAPAAQDARYAYPATLICQLVVVAAIGSWRREAQSPEESEAGVPDIAGSTSSK